MIEVLHEELGWGVRFHGVVLACFHNQAAALHRAQWIAARAALGPEHIAIRTAKSDPPPRPAGATVFIARDGSPGA